MNGMSQKEKHIEKCFMLRDHDLETMAHHAVSVYDAIRLDYMCNDEKDKKKSENSHFSLCIQVQYNVKTYPSGKHVHEKYTP